ncbi:MAG: ROK family protein [Planctomycetes bacterium]|nr:ROK family protein [Planctomycetota bacterium]
MFLGIEIGGTKLQLGIGAGDGVLRARWRGDVDVTEGGVGIRRQILDAVPALLTDAKLQHGDLRGIGIGFGGPVDDARRTVIKSHQIEGWENFPLADWISQALGLPAVLGNDADVAGLAEAHHGAGKGLSPIFYITIGSGIGGGFIVDGQIYRGQGRGGAEIGHVHVFDPASRKEDLLEHVASGWAIGRRASSRSGGQITAREVGDRARNGDPRALDVLSETCDALWQAIRHVIVLLCPRRIVIGGGVSLMGDPLFRPLRERLAQLDFEPFRGLTDIVPAALGEDVVVHGALTLAAM